MLRSIHCTARDLAAERHALASSDVHFTESLATAVIGAFTLPGERILDPFAGFGTTLVVGERLGRVVAGVELLPERAELIRTRVSSQARVEQGDARRLDSLELGSFALCLTSPPYMNAFEHPENPLTGYRTLDGAYPTYLSELGAVFATVGRCLTPRGRLVINAANIATDGRITTLAWDLAREVSSHLEFLGEITVCWDQLPDRTTGDYCLVFGPLRR